MFTRARDLLRPPRACAGALCWRKAGADVEILLVTTRGTGRPTPPRGRIEPSDTSADTALREAWEEAGVVGTVDPTPLGGYYGVSSWRPGRPPRYACLLHALEVERLEDEYPEAGQRERFWVGAEEAARRVRERGLKRLIADFRP